MEAIGDQLAEFGGFAGVFPRTPRRGGRRYYAFDDGTPRGFPARLHPVPASAPAAERDTPTVSGAPGPPLRGQTVAAGSGPEAAITGTMPDVARDPGGTACPSPTAAIGPPAVGGTGVLDLAGISGLVAGFAAAAPEVLASADYVEAANFAGQVEEIARSVEYLQVLAAGAVDRTRTRAITHVAAARASAARSSGGWVTGWTADGVETLNQPPALPETDANWPAHTSPTPERPAVISPADDGCRTTAGFLRLRLRIPVREATRRLNLAHQTLPGTTLTGEPTPPLREHLATALTPTRDSTTSSIPALPSAPAVSSYAATIITATLDRLQHHTTAETLDLIEHQLTTTAATADPDFLTRVARRWADTINADGTEPTEEALRHTQGAFIRKPRHGLHHLEIFATSAQYEHLATAMNAATNPRTSDNTANHSSNHPAHVTDGHDNDTGNVTDGHGNDPDLDRRTRPQRQLDGILSALTAGLTTNQLPTTGGNRPQIIATINYQDLFPHTGAHTRRGPGTHAPHPEPDTTHEPAPRPGHPNRAGSRTGTGTFAFTGPIAAATLRKLACDADIIPAILGTNGEILDLGRKTRLFTPAQRLALTARDQGCAFPNCTAPAPWCEAHHITYWSHGGDTSINNGVLLCSHHHHLIHKEQWTITVQHGIPTFIPPPHIDPTQKPQQNHYFKPPPPPPEPGQTRRHDDHARPRIRGVEPKSASAPETLRLGVRR
ncbi:HNH endonuclease signature motif containing protein [Arthrobacter sp. AD-310]